MHTVYCDGQLIYNPAIADSGYYVISPTLNLEDNKQGSLKFSIPVNHPRYDLFTMRKSIITVFDDDELIFRGRLIDSKTDFNKTKTVNIEGELSFFLDTIVRPFNYSGSVEDFVTFIVDEHNSQCDDNSHKFTLGNITVTDPNNYIVRSSEGAMTCWECLTSRCIKLLGGHLVTRHIGDVTYLDYLADDDYGSVSTQKIEFGKNMLDLANFVSASDVITVLIPYGAKINEGEQGYFVPSGNSKYDGNRITIRTVNAGLDYIESQSGIELFGKVWGTEIWDDVTLPSNLKTKATAWLNGNITANLTLNITGIDLHTLNVDVARIKLGDIVPVKSAAHGIDTQIRCTKLTIQLDKPSNTKVTLGNVRKTLTDL